MGGTEKARAAGAAGIAVAAIVLAGMTGCSGSGDESAPQACHGGRYTWTNVSQRSVLTDMATVEAHRKGDRVSSRHAREVARYTAAVRTTAGPELPARTVIHALAGKMGAGELAGDEGSATTSRYDGSAYAVSEAAAPGRYVAARAIRLVEADFRYSCAAPGEDSLTTRGHVTTFVLGNEVGVVACREKPDHGQAAGIRKAARLGCRKGDPGRAS
ncbi:hypothetical protein ACZ90_36910 [Streptomyces albus subsp. albus]|nr:hypothetical protein ACZ90_36910 [Streptomyces albus subsp. albus]